MYCYFKTQLMLWLRRKITLHQNCWKFCLTSQIITRDVYVRDNYCQKLKFLKKVMIGCWLPLKKNKQRPLDSLFLSQHMFFSQASTLNKLNSKLNLNLIVNVFLKFRWNNIHYSKFGKETHFLPWLHSITHRLYSFVQRRSLMFHNH